MLGDVKLIFRPGTDRTKFIGDKGWIQVLRGPDLNGASDPAFDPKKPGQAGGTDDKSLQVSTNHSAELHPGHQVRQAAVSNIQDAVRSDIISLLCDIAVRTGEKITWDPKKRDLVNPSPAAKAMLSRKMRSPWTL